MPLSVTRETALTWSWLNVLTKKRYDALLEVYGDLEHALAQVNENLLKSLGCREETVYIVLNRLDEFDPDAYGKELNKRGLDLLFLEGSSYPARLKEIGDPPIFLYHRGDISLLDQPCIAVVGTRNMSMYGKRVTQEFIPELVRSGMITVSGLAKGIDAAVAQETLRTGGKTVAVLGHGLGSIYPPSNRKLAEEIVDNGGLLLSEYPIDINPDKYTFPARNRIIAGLSLGTVVLEAGEGSGALITADLALDYGREVFAVPGQVFDEHFAGCHQLIARGQAKLASSAEDIISEFGISPSSASGGLGASPSESQKVASEYDPKDAVEAALWKALTAMPQSTDDIAEKSGIDLSALNATLTMMELNGAAKNVGNGMWVRS